MAPFTSFQVTMAAFVLALTAGRVGAQDSTFLLATTDPARAPSPVVGNGRLGVVIPALGFGASNSFIAGLYEEAPGDVPRIAALPAWNAIGVFDGARWLDSTSPGSLRAYHQALDMRTGTVRTSYDWAEDTRFISVATEAFVSRADPHLAVIRLELRPRHEGRMRVRFAMAGRPPPPRLALARLERADPAWKPADVWYPGHMVVRSRDAAAMPGGGSFSMTATPEGRTTALAQAAAVSWSPGLPRATTRTVASGDSALVEVAFDASPGAVYRFVQVTGVISAAEGPFPLARAKQEARVGLARGYDSLAADNARAWARRWETDIEIQGDPALQRVVRSMLFYLLCSADTGTGLGVPPMGLTSGGYYGHFFWDSDTWMFPPLLVTHPDIAHSLVDFRGRTLAAARARAREHGYLGAMYPWEADERGRETTPRFAVQNARSEIHVTGDVALAQWQYFLATGDSVWLARDGYPVIRETANFWLSRSVYDSTADRYHIENVVSVHEGLIGVTDDACTNAVARKNLEIAAEASRRLGRPADPRWSRMATRLHLPYDSASRFYRTYEGAPDSTLGAVTPLLSYPLGVPMSAESKRTQLQQAVRRLLRQGPGAMMGSTLLSVDAAELGDRALLDTLLPHSYQGYLRGPFLMLSETPANDAVNFVTGAGGFLQQVIFGWTGLRIGEGGLEPAFPPLLPSRVTSLALRNVHARGARFDVVVDSSGRRIVPRAGTAVAAVGAEPRRPVLEFPEPGVDDPAAYQGYQTRFYRDSRDNTVQVYLEPRSARVVSLLADAANESAGFTVRDARGRPARLEWGAPEAGVGETDGLRYLEFRLSADVPSIEIGWLLLGSMRIERDFQYGRHHLRPFTAPPFRVAEESLLVAAVAGLPDDARARHLALLRAGDMEELRARLLPSLELTGTDTQWVVRAERPSLDGRNRLLLELRGDPRQSAARLTGRTVEVHARSGAEVRFAVRVATDAAPLTPLGREEIFNREFLDFVAAAAGAGDSAGQARHRRLERQVRGVELLSSREKLMAGLPNFATYFGRDMMMTALMMRPIWAPTMAEHVIAGVLRKLGPEGQVSHEEALGGQAVREHAVEYDSLVRAGRLDLAAAVLRSLQATRENYHMIDDEFQLPVLAARYLADPAVAADRKRAFLQDSGDGGGSRLARLLRELRLVARLTRPYADDPRAANLISFPRRDSTHWRSASWRDSDAGYAGGRYALDVNAIWAPQALDAIATIVAALPALGLRPGALGDSASFARAARTWRGARRHFMVTFAPREIETRIAAKLAWLPEPERRYWRDVMKTAGEVREPLAFLALSLDDGGKPIPVVNTDPATGLFLDTAGAAPATVLGDVAPFLRPFPVGLQVAGLGPLAANDAYAPRKVWERFREDTYHSPRVVWGREVNLLLLGFANQISAAADDSASYVAALHDALRRTRAAVNASGLQHNELWSYRIEQGKLLPTRYGTSSDVQLWNSTDLAVQFVLSRLPER
jgi:trehalose/maltose hydrolase-like predicted phosphorylase